VRRLLGAAAVTCMALGCVRASVRGERAHETAKPCIRTLLVAVEARPKFGTSQLVDRMGEEFDKQWVEAEAFEVQRVDDLRAAEIADRIGHMKPDALLVVSHDSADSNAPAGLLFVPAAEDQLQHVFKLSVYEYTPERSLVEVWKAKLDTTKPGFSRYLGPEQATQVVQEIAAQLADAGLSGKCEKS
jgi:hypothetical protein